MRFDKSAFLKIFPRNWISDEICHTAVHIRRVIEAVITRRSWKFASISVAKSSKSLVNTDFSGTPKATENSISKNISKKIEYPMISAKAVSYMEAYRSGHNEAVLKTVWVWKPTGVRIPLPPPEPWSIMFQGFFLCLQRINFWFVTLWTKGRFR